jgi:purine-binding chemotaxis protein CheW
MTQLIVFRLDQGRYALPLDVVERVVRAVEVTPLPNAPAIVLGAIDVHGQVLPVLNTRRRFLLPDRDICPADWFLLGHTTRRMVALVVDEAEGLVECADADIVPSARIAPGLERFPGVITLRDELVLIHDLERFLSLDEATALDDAMNERRGA